MKRGPAKVTDDQTDEWGAGGDEAERTRRNLEKFSK